MRISIALATYNGISYIREQLDSLKLQTRTPDEVIITDDASTDGTYEYVKDYIVDNSLDSWKVIKNEQRLGYISNFNKALELSSGDIIFTCDQDDIWDVSKLELTEKLMESDDTVELVASSLEFVDTQGNRIAKEYIPYNMKDVPDGKAVKIDIMRILEKNFFPGCTMAIRKNVVQQYLAVENRNIAHDWLMAIIAAADNGLVWYNLKLISYRIHENNTVGLLAATSNKMNYIKKTIDSWHEYCYELDKRMRFAQKYLTINDENRDDFIFFNEINNLRNIIVLNKGNKRENSLTGNEICSFRERFASFLKEIRICQRVGTEWFDKRGILIDFIYVFKGARI